MMTRTILGLLTATLITSPITAAPAPPAMKPFAPPTRPLDERTADRAITELARPPAPGPITLPLPPDHRVSKAAQLVPIDPARHAQVHAAIDRGLAFLRSKQNARGAWMLESVAAPSDDPFAPAPVNVAVTALALKAFIQVAPEEGAPADDLTMDAMRRAARFVLSARADDGSFGGGPIANYVTASVVSALAGMDELAFEEPRASAVAWLQRNQWDQSEGLDPRQDWFGGSGYGKHGRPDLSNTQMMLEALYDAGVSPDDPAVQRPLAFVSRTQNHKATNDAAWAGDDGGFIYTPAGGGESMASEAAGDGRRGELKPEGSPRSLRSYGSMTYAGFKSMLYAGMGEDDPRVQAAFEWIRRHWTFDENPGMGQQGLYYYYHTMARALRIAQQTSITSTDGAVHPWREELVDALLSRQREDGSWRNEADRWLEGEPVMATVYALLALEEAIKPALGEVGREPNGPMDQSPNGPIGMDD